MSSPRSDQVAIGGSDWTNERGKRGQGHERTEHQKRMMLMTGEETCGEIDR